MLPSAHNNGNVVVLPGTWQRCAAHVDTQLLSAWVSQAIMAVAKVAVTSDYAVAAVRAVVVAVRRSVVCAPMHG